MISEQNIASLISGNITDTDGRKIGTVGQIYVNPDTGRPNSATVVTGLFRTSESSVPLDRADTTADGELRVPYSKDEVKPPPRRYRHRLTPKPTNCTSTTRWAAPPPILRTSSPMGATATQEPAHTRPRRQATTPPGRPRMTQ